MRRRSGCSARCTAPAKPGVVPPLRAVASSALIFSGAAQFTAAGLLAGGAGAAAVVASVALLNLRHVVLGAVLRQRIRAGGPTRAALAFLLIDETAGLALHAKGDARRAFLVAGATCYIAWVAGTAIGVTVGGVLEDPALVDAVFPVLFVGLAAASAWRRRSRARAVALASTLGLALLIGDLAGLLPILVALGVMLAGVRR
nr:AzlC family ABC transporter permease [Egibacter rhizosphaerae]